MGGVTGTGRRLEGVGGGRLACMFAGRDVAEEGWESCRLDRRADRGDAATARERDSNNNKYYYYYNNNTSQYSNRIVSNMKVIIISI